MPLIRTHPDESQGPAVAPETVDERLRRVIACHFDPECGSAYWLDRQTRLGIDVRREVTSPADLGVLGEMSPAELSERPLLDYIPRRFHGQLDRFIIGQTGGTTGGGTWTAYREDEFREAFIDPFAAAVAHLGFPRGERWLYVGPSGPHIIGKVVRHLAASVGSGDRFSVDFHARWAKRLPEGSFAARRYLEHVVEQAMEVIARQEIGVIFATPPVLAALGETMSDTQRRRIRGVHYGGMALASEQLHEFQTRLFPGAVHLSGYGNTLFGCCLELSTQPGRELDYYPWGNRLILEVVNEEGRKLDPGGVGQVRFTRLDDSFVIFRLRERDQAVLLPRPDGGPPGFCLSGVRNPHTNPGSGVRLAVGLY
jgi:thienamycin biosynthesis protein ThnN